MTSEIKISIVTVCYNAESSIEETIKSVLQQTYQNVEYVIVDGGSTDRTIDIIKKYDDCIAKWISEPDKGIYDAMNKSLRIASGDFLLFLGADDILYNKTVLEDVVKQILSKEYVYYGSVLFKQSGKVFKGRFNRYKWGIINICHQAIFYPKHVYMNYEYDLEYKVYADYAYNLKLLSNKVIFKYVKNIITLYNSAGFSSRTIDTKFEENKLTLIKEAVGWLPMVCGILYRFTLKFRK